jgi:hypothetical protein
LGAVRELRISEDCEICESNRKGEGKKGLDNIGQKRGEEGEILCLQKNKRK